MLTIILIALTLASLAADRLYTMAQAARMAAESRREVEWLEREEMARRMMAE